MITFPCAKINLGLNVVAQRTDGYHDIETVMYPVPLTDALEIKLMGEEFPSPMACDLKVTGPTAVDCPEADNLVVRAYHLLAADFELPRIHAHLFKRIPSQAGLGGGSADGAFMIRLLDERFRLNIGIPEMERYAAELGSDCPFFITGSPAYCTGRGEMIRPVDNADSLLHGYHIVIVKPPVAVSTREAYAALACRRPSRCCLDIVGQPVETWRHNLVNDFEEPVFALYPQLAALKEKLYALGADYAAMSGSGSALFGLFRKQPMDAASAFPDCSTWQARL